MTAPAKESRVAVTAASVGKTAMVLRDRLTPEMIDLLKKTVAKGASDDEFAVFLHQCERTGLDPFARQIYCLQRRTKNEAGEWVNAMVTQVGIDGFRLVAQRTGEYRGQTVPMYADSAGNWRDFWPDPKKPPVACKVGVVREGFSEPLFAIAMYEEYVQRTRDGNPNAMWKGKPTVMLAKCAEAMALRKAFPQELSGLYTEDELHDDVEVVEVRAETTTKTTARLAGETMSVNATDDGDIVLNFGVHRGKKVSQVPTSYLLETFRDPWKDEGRKQVAAERLGAGFVAFVYGELGRRKVPDDCTVHIAKLWEKKATGESLTDDELEELRQWTEDHPTPASSNP